MRNLLRAAPLGEAPVLAWPAICGPAVASRTRALRFAAGVLHIEVPDAGWQAELSALEGRYVHEFGLWLGENRVRHIQFVVR
jgi:hypothetical protein